MYLADALKNVLRKSANFVQSGENSSALNLLSSEVSNIARITSRVKDVDVTDIDDAVAHFDYVQKMAAEGRVGIRTGIKSLDICLPMGIADGQLGIMLAYPAIGKSWLALHLAAQAWKVGKKPMIISLEMTEKEVRNRIYTILGDGKWSHRKLSSGDVDREEFAAWADENLKDKPKFKIISMDGESAMTPNLVRGKIDQYKPDIVFIDYLQLMTDNGNTSGSEVIKVKNLSRELKLLAISCNLPVVAITSATPDDAQDLESVPQLGQVAWSKQIAYDADWILAMGRKAHSTALEVAFRKNRNGSLGDFIMNVDFDSGRFKEVFDIS